METDRINFILNNSSEATKDDVFLLEKEIRKYPFSQMLHILLAKVQSNLNSEGKNKRLTTAAIYTSDRAVLKKVIQDKGYLEDYNKNLVHQHLPVYVQDSNASGEKKNISSPSEDESASFFAEVLENLKRLKSLRTQFLFLEDKMEKSVNQEEPVVVKEKSSEKTIKKTDTAKAERKRTERIKPKKSESRQKKLNEIIEKDEVLDTKVNAFFLSEIEKNEESKEPENSENIDQKQIIEKFIVEQPSIGSLKKATEKSSEEINRDLSERSTKFGDDLISENLAIILLKQGKKERSIDIYKKLIWKLPQKKAYFAARIEEIKK